MKFLYFLAAFTSLTSAVATAAAPSDAAARPPPLACKCAPIECPTSQPEVRPQVFSFPFPHHRHRVLHSSFSTYKFLSDS